MTQYRRSDLDRRPAFFRYIYFLVSTGKFQTFRRWRGNGEPNPFVRPDYAPRATSENEIIETFDQQLRTVRSRPLSRIV